MLENFPIPSERGNHRLFLRGEHVVFEPKDQVASHMEIHLGQLRQSYEELYCDGTEFREAFYLSLSRSDLPLPLNVDHDAMAMQIRANDTYVKHRTLDDDDD